MKKQIKVACFSSDTPKNKVLSSNGKSLDRYCVKCIPDEDLSTGNYICDLTFLIDDNIQDLLQEEAILKILMDYGNEIFRISKVTVGTRYIYVVARQITIADSLTLWLEDVRPTNLNGQGAVSWLLDNAQGKKEIQIISDIDAVATAYYQRMSLYKALHDSDNSFLNRWGGEIQRRGYTVYINKRIGIDRGFTIREGKNLTGFESTSNIDSLVTRAIGQGYNGILGNYIDSPLIGSYNQIYTSVIKYDDVKVKDEYNDEGYDTLEQAQAELDRRIEEEFSENDIDKIKASYTINFVQLEKTEEYKKYIIAEKLFIGDDCRVYIPKLNVDIKVRALSKKYDVLAQKTKEINLSNYIETKPLTLKQIADKLDAIDSTATILQLAKDNATSLIKDGLKNSYVIVRENEIIIGDTKDINTMNKVWRWNNGGLGFSSTGYYGEFGTAITQDGAIVADFITTGILNANLIKTGIIKALNGESWINLDSGDVQITGELRSKSGSQWVGLNSGGLTFQDWNKEEQMLRVGIAYFDSNRDINGVEFAMPQYSDFIRFSHIAKPNLNEGWTSEDTFYNFFELWSGQQTVNGIVKKKGMTINSPLWINNNINIASNDSNSPHNIYNTTEGKLLICGDNGVIIGYRNGTQNLIRLYINETDDSNGCAINAYGNWNFNGGVLKNCTVSTTLNLSDTSTYSLEEATTEAQAIYSIDKELRVLLEDIQLENGEATVINPYPKRQYSISSIVKKGRGDVWIDSETENSFIIKGENDIKVNIEIIIKLSDSINSIQEEMINGGSYEYKDN